MPLREKWVRRLTLGVELGAFACISFGLVFAVAETYVSIDPTTLDELGFLFIISSSISTIFGGIISAMQITGLIIELIRYLRKLKKRRTAVIPFTDASPISLSENYKNLELKLKHIDSVSDTEKTSLGMSDAFPLSMKRLDSGVEERAMKKIGILSPRDLAKTPQGTDLLGKIKEWWKASGQDLETDNESKLTQRPKTLAEKLKSRIISIPEDL